MERVTGLGGVFIKAKDPKVLGEWYARHLGVPVEEWGGAQFPLHVSEAGDKQGALVWSVMPATTTYFAPSQAPFMVNFRVRDRDAMLRQLREAGAAVDEKTEDSEFGKFGWVMDPEGNKVELWEPPSAAG